MRCPNCNRYNVDDALYCRVCGKELNVNEEKNVDDVCCASSETGKYICKFVAIALCVFAVVATICNFTFAPSLAMAGFMAGKLWNMNL